MADSTAYSSMITLEIILCIPDHVNLLFTDDIPDPFDPALKLFSFNWAVFSIQHFPSNGIFHLLMAKGGAKTIGLSQPMTQP